MSYSGAAPVSSPGAGAQGNAPQDMASKTVMLRAMRLKVLYTFDEQNKINCLARWPHIVNVQTVDLDENTSIGVVELKTCIQAVVSASPELVAKLGQDYTIYAYDYSESDTPLVGQGMLSWALASNSSGNGAATPRSRALVTGRVCKNVLGLFASGASETLEVKLRLVPVPACLQSDFVKNMDTYRELSRVMPTDFDATTWGAFLQENPNARELAEQLKSPANQTRDLQSAGAGMEALSRLMSPGLSMDDPAQHFEAAIQQAMGSQTIGIGSPFDATSRTASPFPSLDHQRDSMANSMLTGHPRPPSRGSIGGVELPTHDTRSENLQSGYETGDSSAHTAHGEGPAKKRARTTKADWKGKALGGKSVESLRVTASTAGSIRTFRPIAVRPPGIEGTAFDEIPRPPTPRPDVPKEKPRRGRPRTRTTLRSESYQSQTPPPPTSSEPPARQPMESASVMHVPEEPRNTSAATTPADIASSPPVMDQPSPAPSSPVLPMLPPQIDSGFMSGPAEETFEDDNETRPIDDEDLEVAAQYSRRDNVATEKTLLIEQVTPGPPELLPTRILPRPEPPQRRKKTQSTATPLSEAGGSPGESQQVSASPVDTSKPDALPAPPPPDHGHTVSLPSVNQPRPPSRSLSRTPSMGGLILPPQTADDPADPTSTDANADSAQTGGARTGQLRSGSGAKRKRAIQKRLQDAIGSGQMPPFCENCGAIETPTWRKAWSKRVVGSTLNVSLSTEEAGILAIQHVEKDESGKVVSFTILKKALLEDDEGFKEIQLCNPCGLWLHKFKCMRPEEKWNKDTKDSNDKKKRPAKKRKQSDSADVGTPASDVPDITNSQDDHAPAQEASEGHDDANTTKPAESITIEERKRAASLEPAAFESLDKGGGAQASFAAVMERAVRSSPVRGIGTQGSPIELDDFGSTRRLLFSSPKRPQDGKALQDITGQDNRRPDKHAERDATLKRQNTSGSDKENMTPSTIELDELEKLFEEDGLDEPRTPPRKSPSTRTLRSSSRSTLRRRAHQQSSPWKFDLSPSSQRQALLPRTPSTRNKSKSPRSSRLGNQLSPFSAQMYQLLSEANYSPTARALDANSLPAFGDLLPDGTNSPKGHALFNMAADLNSEILSTDLPMPSSPPNFFSLYEDPVEPTSGIWSDFDAPDATDKGTQQGPSQQPANPQTETQSVATTPADQAA